MGFFLHFTKCHNIAGTLVKKLLTSIGWNRFRLNAACWFTVSPPLHLCDPVHPYGIWLNGTSEILVIDNVEDKVEKLGNLDKLEALDAQTKHGNFGKRDREQHWQMCFPCRTIYPNVLPSFLFLLLLIFNMKNIIQKRNDLHHLNG